MIDEYFQTLTTFPAQNFQRKAIAKLVNHQDILLHAPTGSGKTETAIALSFPIQPKQRSLSPHYT